MKNITIRKMQKKDIEQIMRIESVSFGSFFWNPDSFASEMHTDIGHYFVAEDKDDKIIGYCGFWLILDEAHITTIAVNPNLRRKGLGEILLQKMIDTGFEKQAKWFTLEVRASNIAAQNLYFKYGFKSLGLRKKYYEDNEEDAMIMWTENIWESEFKNLYQKLKTKLNEKVNV